MCSVTSLQKYSMDTAKANNFVSLSFNADRFEVASSRKLQINLRIEKPDNDSQWNLVGRRQKGKKEREEWCVGGSR